MNVTTRTINRNKHKIEDEGRALRNLHNIFDQHAQVHSHLRQVKRKVNHIARANHK